MNLVCSSAFRRVALIDTCFTLETRINAVLHTLSTRINEILHTLKELFTGCLFVVPPSGGLQC